MNNRKLSNKVRVYHRYLGFFLSGIMAMYAISGIVMIYRNTDAFKIEEKIEKNVGKDLTSDELGKTLKFRNFKADSEEGTKIYFKDGVYDKTSGIANYSQKELPFILKQMTGIHKATTDRPLYYLNIFFGVSLLFFVLSAFWMFLPKTPIFKKGMLFTLAGILLTIALLFI
ncbi:hypothetical protein [Gramella sp. AN32]|uniref:Uncharacterized protein n=1 Tax=Christiangramia antarctica TaxID=2058158 RepID=A0ABW5X8Z8_9FLAO|nr:hypothetical protein [Gramella sp. AN32]MCM4158197.1 hypothetical protein [Gramella sp. AN32]